MSEPSPPPSVAFGDFQIEIYLAGLSGTIPALPMDYVHLEARAAQAFHAGPPTRTAVSPSCWPQPAPATLWTRWPPLMGRILPRLWSAKGEGLRRESGQLRDHSPCISAIAASKRSRARSTGPRLAAGIHGSAR